EPYVNSLNAFVALLQKAASDKAVADQKAFLQSGEQTLSNSFQLFNTAVDELDTLLRMRIEANQHKRLMGLLIAAAILLVASVIAYFVIRRLTLAVSGLVRQIHTSGTQVSSSSNEIASSTKQLEAAV